MSVAIGYTHTGMVYQPFMQCVINLMAYDAAHRKSISQLIGIGHPYIPFARQSVVEQFMVGKADWLLFLDYDMIFDGDYLDRLRDIAEKEGTPILGALYYTFMYGTVAPCWMEYREGKHNMPMDRIEEDKLYELSTVGMGFTLIHRDVFTTMKDRIDDPWCWYGHDIMGGERVGEDVTFCARARDLGFPTYGSSAVRCGHIKRQDVSIDTYNALRGDTLPQAVGT